MDYAKFWLRWLDGRRAEDYLLAPSIARDRGIIRTRRHWAVLLKVLSQTILITLVVFLLFLQLSTITREMWWFPSLLWYIAVAALTRFAIHLLWWWQEIIVVTDKRIMVSRNAVVEKRSVIQITEVTDVSVMLPVLGRLLGYCTVRLYLAGKDREHILYMPSPDVVFTAIADLVCGEEIQARSNI